MPDFAIDWGSRQAPAGVNYRAERLLADESPGVEVWLPPARNVVASGWQHRFVNHLGASDAPAGPNAGLRIQLSATVEAAPRTSSL